MTGSEVTPIFVRKLHPKEVETLDLSGDKGRPDHRRSEHYYGVIVGDQQVYLTDTQVGARAVCEYLRSVANR